MSPNWAAMFSGTLWTGTEIWDSGNIGPHLWETAEGVQYYGNETVNIINWYHSGTSIKRPPSIKQPFSKSPEFFVTLQFKTSIQRPPLISGHCKVIIFVFFTSTKQPTNYLFKQNGERKTIIWGHAHYQSILTVCPVSQLPGPCPIILSNRQMTFSLSFHLHAWQQI